MSNYPEGFDDRLLDEGNTLDNADLDQLCAEAEAKLAGYSIEDVVTTDDDAVRDIAHEMDAKIGKMVDDDEGRYEDASFDYREDLKDRCPKLHALLGAL